MTALRISMIFVLSVIIASSWLVASDGLSARPAIHDHQLASVNGLSPVTNFPDQARLCSRLKPRGASLPETMPDTVKPAKYSGGLYREIRARDLPGIVKLEPERDLPNLEVSKGHCSATRIARNWFLSAAHCVSNNYDRINLKAGSEFLSSELIQTIPVDFAICHDGFVGRNNQFENDIALLHVEESQLAHLSEVPIVSWGMTAVPFSTVRFSAARVGGWGLKSFNGELNDHLQKMELDILHIDDRLIRLTSRAGRGPCVGDSGGPLIVEDGGKPVLMGVLSTISANQAGHMCEGSYVSNYTNLASYQRWVVNTMLTCNADKKTCRRG